MNDPLLTLGFFCVFHLIGGIAIGKGLRQLLGRQWSGVLFLLVWGSMFGIMPLLISGSQFAKLEMPYAIYVELFVLIAAILLTALLPEEFIGTFNQPPVIGAGVGAIFFVMGGVLLFVLAREDLGQALLIGGIFMLVGGGVLFAGLYSALKPR